jgi:hypothetical protein
MGRALLAFGLAAAIAAMGTFVACSSFDAAEEGSFEAGSDGPTGDGSAQGDGASDATNDGGSAAWVPCTTRAMLGQLGPAHFCDDFDDGNANVAYKWTEANNLLGGGSIASSQQALTAPRALLSKVQAGSSDSTAFLRQRSADPAAAATKGKITFAFSLRIDAPPYSVGAATNGYTHLAILKLDPPPAGCITAGTALQRHVELTFNGASSTPALEVGLKGLQEVCAPPGGDHDVDSTGVTLQSFADNKFHRVTVTAARASCPTMTGSSLTVAIESNPPFEKCYPLGVDPLVFTTTTNFSIELGIQARGNGAHEAAGFVYDNVTWDFD